MNENMITSVPCTLSQPISSLFNCGKNSPILSRLGRGMKKKRGSERGERNPYGDNET